MSGFQPAVARTIEAFGAQLGVSARPASDGSYSFLFDRSGTLTFTAAEPNRVVLSLARRLRAPNAAIERTILSLAGPDASNRGFLHAGTTRDGSAVFAVSIEAGDLDLPAIEVGLQQLLAAQGALPA